MKSKIGMGWWSGLLVLVVALPARAQYQPAAPAPGLAQTGWLVGCWEGEGWIEQGGQRYTFAQHETVERRVGGHVLLVEGLGTSQMAAGAAPAVVHNAMGMLVHDAQAGTYHFSTYRAGGGPLIADVTMTDDGFVWGFDVPQGGAVRYTVTRSPEGRWHEVGHFLRGGEERHFFEMNLAKKDACE